MESWLEPVLDAEAMRTADRWAIDQVGIPSLELMETAGLAVAEATEELIGDGPVRVVCGKGNNGGDGIVAARRLAEFGHEAEVLLLWPSAELSVDSKANLDRFTGAVREVDPGSIDDALRGSGAVVDAIFGTGFSGAPREPAIAAITAINGCGARILAADVPSGVDASTGEIEGAVVEADMTVTFHAAKLGHVVAPGKWCCGELRLAPIGIPDGAPGSAPAGAIGPGVLAELPLRTARSTKFSSGQVLIVGGSRGLSGAVCLAAEAAIRAGAGYATVAVPEELETIFEVKLTEVMSRGCPSREGAFTAGALEPIIAASARAAAAVLGGGMGRGDEVTTLVRELAPRLDTPLVIDADGLNALAERLEVLAGRRRPTILTPHAGELGRLLGVDSDEIAARRLHHATEAARRSRAIVVLKGDDTIIASPDAGIAINALPSPALATAGTGDVLSGIIGAFLARGLEPFTAASAAVHAHARAGRLAASHVGASESVIAGDVIDALLSVLAGSEEGSGGEGGA